MATTTKRRGGVKRQDSEAGAEAHQTVRDQLEALAREGACEMLTKTLDEEVDGYLGRGRYERTDLYRGYRLYLRVELDAVLRDLREQSPGGKAGAPKKRYRSRDAR